MFVDARTVPDGTRLEADLCIIGAGAAGIAIARSFDGRSTRVVVLESGDVEFDSATQALDMGANIGLPYFPLDTSRLRFLGGTTNHWGGLCRPMDAEDFEARSWIPRSGWPITRSTLDPYYERASKTVHLPRSAWALDDWLPDDSYEPIDVDHARIITRFVQLVDGDVRSFGTTYHKQLERSANIAVHLRANATEIVTDAASRTTTEIRAATLDGNRFSVVARAYVLCVGGIENARLLLASNRQRPAGVGNDHDLVGRYFLEHPRFVAASFMPADRDLSLDFYEHHRVGPSFIQGYLSLDRDVQRQEQLGDVQMTVRAQFDPAFEAALTSNAVEIAQEFADEGLPEKLGDLAEKVADVLEDVSTWQSFLVPGAPLPVPYPEIIGEVMRRSPPDIQALIPEVFGDIAGVAYKKVYGAPLESAVLLTRFDPEPNPASRVTLGTERDALGMPRAQLDWRLSADDRHSVQRSLEILGAELGRSGLGRLQITFDEKGTTWPDDLAGGWHHMGTTRMSSDPKQGVVDPDCRVHGMDNLYVAGSSVFTTAGSGTPTLTLVALALRLADHLDGVLA